MSPTLYAHNFLKLLVLVSTVICSPLILCLTPARAASRPTRRRHCPVQTQSHTRKQKKCSCFSLPFSLLNTPKKTDKSFCCRKGDSGIQDPCSPGVNPSPTKFYQARRYVGSGDSLLGLTFTAALYRRGCPFSRPGLSNPPRYETSPRCKCADMPCPRTLCYLPQ